MAELIVIGVVILAVTYILAHYRNDPVVPPLRPYYSVTVQPKPKRHKPKPKPKRKTGLNDMQKLAKDTLVTMGYSATEAKKMLEGINASTPEQYVQEAMKRVKI